MKETQRLQVRGLRSWRQCKSDFTVEVCTCEVLNSIKPFSVHVFSCMTGGGLEQLEAMQATFN